MDLCCIGIICMRRHFFYFKGSTPYCSAYNSYEIKKRESISGERTPKYMVGKIQDVSIGIK